MKVAYLKVIRFDEEIMFTSHDDLFVDEDEGPSIEELAKTMYQDFQTMNDRDDYGWKGGTLRPTDYDSVENVVRALEGYAPLPQHNEIEASFGDEESGTHAEFSYNIRHILTPNMVEEDTDSLHH